MHDPGEGIVQPDGNASPHRVCLFPHVCHPGELEKNHRNKALFVCLFVSQINQLSEESGEK